MLSPRKVDERGCLYDKQSVRGDVFFALIIPDIETIIENFH